MNMKTLIIGSVVLVLSLFANIALGFNVSGKNQDFKQEQEMRKELQAEVESLKTELSSAEGIIVDENLGEDQNSKALVEAFFNTQYEYSTETYKERFEKIKEYVNESVYGQLTSAGIPDIPNIKFENKINELKVFMSAKDSDLSGLVLMKSAYEVDGVEAPETTQIFNVTVAEENGQKKIVELEVLGSFAAMSES